MWRKKRRVLHVFLPVLPQLKWKRESQSAASCRTWEFGKQIALVQNRLEALKRPLKPFLFADLASYQFYLQSLADNERGKMHTLPPFFLGRPEIVTRITSTKPRLKPSSP